MWERVRETDRILSVCVGERECLRMCERKKKGLFVDVWEKDGEKRVFVSMREECERLEFRMYIAYFAEESIQKAIGKILKAFLHIYYNNYK